MAEYLILNQILDQHMADRIRKPNHPVLVAYSSSVIVQYVRDQQYTLVFLGYVIIVINDVLPSYTLLLTSCRIVQ
jgi:hypothetical protein